MEVIKNKKIICVLFFKLVHLRDTILLVLHFPNQIYTRIRWADKKSVLCIQKMTELMKHWLSLI